MNVAVLRPVWLALARDPRITLAFAAEREAAVREALARDGQAAALVTRAAAAWTRWDLVLTADAWNHTPVRRCRRRMQFFHGVAGKYDLDAPEQLRAAGLDRFDRIAFINADRLQRYVRAGAVSADRAVLVGYPKADDLVNGRWSRSAVRASIHLDERRATVIYAPTFSTASSLHLAGLDIVRALLDAGVNVIVKLHDRSMIPDAHHTGGIDWPDRMSVFAAHPRFVLARDADAEPFLAAADVLVTDHSTVGFEFALLDRPLVVYDAPDLRQAARIDAGKWELLRSMATVAHTPAETVDAVLDALAQPSRLSPARTRAQELFAAPGTATERALAVVYELLDLTSLPAQERQAEAASLSPATGIGR
jgi:CDP-glycerol glycerophosphotransferase (TagB/SpsB family)